MTLEEAITLLDYHYWGRDRILDAVEVLTPEQVPRRIWAAASNPCMKRSCIPMGRSGIGT